MLYFPGCSAGDCGFTTAFLNVVADGFAVVALVTEHLVPGSQSIPASRPETP
jgi:hypothetical protein